MSAKPTRINLRPYRILYWPLLLPVALLLALFNKLSPIPFKIYALRVNRIGQMAGNQEELLCQLDLGLLPKEFRVYIHRDKPCNEAFLTMQKRALPIYNIFLPLFDVCHKLGGLGISSMEMERYSGRDWEQWVTKTPQHFHFTEEEAWEAQRQCRELGIDLERPFVPVLARDTGYLAHIKEPTDQMSYRNDDINSYVPALEWLADSWKVIRMGNVVRTELRTTHPNILDYSKSGKVTELLDIYLSAMGAFFMSCSTGLDAIAGCNFRRPLLSVNLTPVANAPIMKPTSIFIPKKIWHVKEERYLTLSEILESGAGHHSSPTELEKYGVVLQDNTPEEILAATKEMKGRLDGTWIDSPEDIERQKTFWRIYEKIAWRPYECVGRIGSDFLRENFTWLE